MAQSGSVDPGSPILLLLVCRVRLYCEAIAGLLKSQGGVTLAGVAAPEEDIVARLDAMTPDVVLLDTGPPDALATAAYVIRQKPHTRILGFGVCDVPEQVAACAEAGLLGYVPSTGSIKDVVAAARRVAHGDTVCSVSMADGLFRHLRRNALGGLPPTLETVLTQRQQEIIRLIDQGLSNKQIAQRLSLGTSTVKNHVHGILDRLQVATRTEAAARLRRPPCRF
jgi:DNA-binding NarL/FixJ family response regulator